MSHSPAVDSAEEVPLSVDAYSLAGASLPVEHTVETFTVCKNAVFVGTREGCILWFNTVDFDTGMGSRHWKVELAGSVSDVRRQPVRALVAAEPFSLLLCLIGDVVVVRSLDLPTGSTALTTSSPALLPELTCITGLKDVVSLHAQRYKHSLSLIFNRFHLAMHSRAASRSRRVVLHSTLLSHILAHASPLHMTTLLHPFGTQYSPYRREKKKHTA